MKRLLMVVCAVLILAVSSVGRTMVCAEASSTDAQEVEFTVTDRFGGYMSEIPMEASNHDTAAAKLPDSRSMARTYGKTDMDHVYSLDQIVPNGYRVVRTDMQDGYILLTMHGITPELASSEMLALFPISDPDVKVTMEASLNNTYYLLDGGHILERQDEGIFVMYNAGLEQIYCEQADGAFLGASPEGSLWIKTDDDQLSLHRGGKLVSAIDVSSMLYCTYLGNYEGKAYFDIISDERGQIYLSIDPASLQCDEIAMLHDVFDVVSSGSVCYFSDNWWMTASMKDPLDVIAFTKPHAEENMWEMDESYLISHEFQYDESLKAGFYVYRVYDRRTGSLLDERSDRDLAIYKPTLMVYDQGMILYADVDEDNEEAPGALYLWDVRDYPASKPAGFCKKLDFHVDHERIDKLIGEIYVMYAIKVYCDEAHLDGASSNYEMSTCKDMDKLGYTLIMLKACMAEYPRGFFDEIKASKYDRVIYYLCDGHLPRREDVYSDVVALTWEDGTSLNMSYDVNYWWDMRSHFLHENTHMMEHRLEEETDRFGYAHMNRYWFDRLNSPEYPSMQNYMWERTEENLRGVYDQDGENAWYIDAYSKSTPKEDRARVMDRGLHSSNAKYYRSPHIDRKSRFLNALIREVFPCVRDSGREVFWETRTGIVSLYEEFPDFADIL